jgi:hypothetical protein
MDGVTVRKAIERRFKKLGPVIRKSIPLTWGKENSA